MRSEPEQLDEADETRRDETRREQNENTSKSKILRTLKKLMSWSDEIPEEILHGGGNYKVRINWWSGIIGNIYSTLIFELISNSSLKQECEEFLDKYAGTNYWNNCTNRTTKEDIDHANRVVEMVIQDLETNK